MAKIAALKQMSKTAFAPQSGALVTSTHLYGRDWPYFPTIGVVFAYTAVGLETLGETMAEAQRGLAPEHMIDLVCVLNAGNLVYWQKESGIVERTPLVGAELAVINSPNPLWMATIILQELMQGAWMPAFRLRDYLTLPLGDLGPRYELDPSTEFPASDQ